MKRLVFVLCICALAAPAHAVGVRPVREATKIGEYASWRVSNTTNGDADIEVKTESCGDAATDATDIFVTPDLFTLARGEEQTVRVLPSGKAGCYKITFFERAIDDDGKQKPGTSIKFGFKGRVIQ